MEEPVRKRSSKRSSILKARTPLCELEALEDAEDNTTRNLRKKKRNSKRVSFSETKKIKFFEKDFAADGDGTSSSPEDNKSSVRSPIKAVIKETDDNIGNETLYEVNNMDMTLVQGDKDASFIHEITTIEMDDENSGTSPIGYQYHNYMPGGTVNNNKTHVFEETCAMDLTCVNDNSPLPSNISLEVEVKDEDEDAEDNIDNLDNFNDFQVSSAKSFWKENNTKVCAKAFLSNFLPVESEDNVQAAPLIGMDEKQPGFVYKPSSPPADFHVLSEEYKSRSQLEDDITNTITGSTIPRDQVTFEDSNDSLEMSNLLNKTSAVQKDSLRDSSWPSMLEGTVDTPTFISQMRDLNTEDQACTPKSSTRGLCIQPSSEENLGTPQTIFCNDVLQTDNVIACNTTSPAEVPMFKTSPYRRSPSKMLNISPLRLLTQQHQEQEKKKALDAVATYTEYIKKYGKLDNILGTTAIPTASYGGPNSPDPFRPNSNTHLHTNSMIQSGDKVAEVERMENQFRGLVSSSQDSDVTKFPDYINKSLTNWHEIQKSGKLNKTVPNLKTCNPEGNRILNKSCVKALSDILQKDEHTEKKDNCSSNQNCTLNEITDAVKSHGTGQNAELSQETDIFLADENLNNTPALMTEGLRGKIVDGLVSDADFKAVGNLSSVRSAVESRETLTPNNAQAQEKCMINNPVLPDSTTGDGQLEENPNKTYVVQPGDSEDGDDSKHIPDIPAQQIELNKTYQVNITDDSSRTLKEDKKKKKDRRSTYTISRGESSFQLGEDTIVGSSKEKWLEDDTELLRTEFNMKNPIAYSSMLPLPSDDYRLLSDDDTIEPKELQEDKGVEFTVQKLSASAIVCTTPESKMQIDKDIELSTPEPKIQNEKDIKLSTPEAKMQIDEDIELSTPEAKMQDDENSERSTDKVVMLEEENKEGTSVPGGQSKIDCDDITLKTVNVSNTNFDHSTSWLSKEIKQTTRCMSITERVKLRRSKESVELERSLRNSIREVNESLQAQNETQEQITSILKGKTVEGLKKQLKGLSIPITDSSSNHSSDADSDNIVSSAPKRRRRSSRLYEKLTPCKGLQTPTKSPRKDAPFSKIISPLTRSMLQTTPLKYSVNTTYQKTPSNQQTLTSGPKGEDGNNLEEDLINAHAVTPKNAHLVKKNVSRIPTPASSKRLTRSVIKQSGKPTTNIDIVTTTSDNKPSGKEMSLNKYQPMNVPQEDEQDDITNTDKAVEKVEPLSKEEEITKTTSCIDDLNAFVSRPKIPRDFILSEDHIMHPSMETNIGPAENTPRLKRSLQEKFNTPKEKGGKISRTEIHVISNSDNVASEENDQLKESKENQEVLSMLEKNRSNSMWEIEEFTNCFCRVKLENFKYYKVMVNFKAESRWCTNELYLMDCFHKVINPTRLKQTYTKTSDILLLLKKISAIALSWKPFILDVYHSFYKFLGDIHLYENELPHIQNLMPEEPLPDKYPLKEYIQRMTNCVETIQKSTSPVLPPPLMSAEDLTLPVFIY